MSIILDLDSLFEDTPPKPKPKPRKRPRKREASKPSPAPRAKRKYTTAEVAAFPAGTAVEVHSVHMKMGKWVKGGADQWIDTKTGAPVPDSIMASWAFLEVLGKQKIPPLAPLRQQAPRQQAPPQRPSGFRPLPRHVVGAGELIAYEPMIQEVPQPEVFVDLEDPEAIARRAVALRGTERFGDAVVRFGDGRYWLAPAVVSTGLLLVDTREAGARGQVLGPFQRRLHRWLYRRGEGGDTLKHQERGPMHNYASFRLWGVRSPKIPEARRVAQVREVVESVLEAGRLPEGASRYRR